VGRLRRAPAGGEDRALRTVLATALLVLLAASPGVARVAQYPDGFEERVLARGFDRPTAVDWTPDGRMLVAEKPGVLKVVRPGATSGTVAVDLSDRVNAYSHRGLVGLAVDADFETNHFVYLLYTFELNPLAPDGGGPMVSRLGRFVLGGDDVTGPETVLLGTDAAGPCQTPADEHDCIPSEASSHSVGTVRSAPDGTLFVGSGDGTDFKGVDPVALQTYDERTPRGKILHVDRDGRGLPGHPLCPGDADLTHVCAKVWARGLRNPFRFHLDPDGGLIVGDVGWNSREEIDLIGPDDAGRSWGWPCHEGSDRTPGYSDLPECDAAAIGPQEPPDLDYPHTGFHSVLAGPELDGRIYFADWSAGWIRHADPQLGDVTDFATGWQGVGLEATPEGNLAYPSWDGTVRKIVHAERPADRVPDRPSPAVEAQVQANPPVTDQPRADERCFVPDVRGRTRTAAREALARRRCRTGRVTKRRARGTRAGRVVAQRPARPARLPRNGRVALVVGR
jgi:glucose/arabinose dehydrogenase